MSTHAIVLAFATIALVGAAGFVMASDRGGAPAGKSEAVPAGYKATSTPVEQGAESRLRMATFGAGCFWGVETAFRQTKGVTHTAVGYAGGKTADPTYKQVCSDTTGHAEVVGVIYDPQIISYEQLLAVFWGNHNPTTLNRQGPDVGSQYRSVIFYYDDAQKAAAEASKQAVIDSRKWGDRSIVTEIVPASTFYFAEDYHQQYLEKRGITTCH